MNDLYEPKLFVIVAVTIVSALDVDDEEGIQPGVVEKVGDEYLEIESLLLRWIKRHPYFSLTRI